MKTYLFAAVAALSLTPAFAHAEAFNGAYGGDRKSTRLNSSHT